MRRQLLTLLLLLAPALQACECEKRAPEWPVRPAEGVVRVVEAAQPEGGAQSTFAHSDLTVPPREGDLGWWTTLAVDGRGRPHLAYTDAFDGELHYAVWAEDHWEVVAVDSYGAVGKYPSVAVGPDDRPHVLYYNQDNRRLYHATLVGEDRVSPDDRRTPYKAAPGWSFEVIDEGQEVGMASRLTIDPDGKAHAFYYSADRKLWHAWRDPTPPGEHTRWHREVVDPMTEGSHSIVLGHARAPDGTIHLSYSNWTVFDSEQRYAVRAPSAKAWTVETVAKENNAGWKSGLVLDDAGSPVVVFLALLERQLRIATRDGSGKWTVTPLAEDANTMSFARVDGGHLVLAYEYLPGTSLAGAMVRFLSRKDAKGDLTTGWTINELPGTSMSAYVSLDLGPEGEPVIAWYDGTIRGVRVWTPQPLSGNPAPPPEK